MSRALPFTIQSAKAPYAKEGPKPVLNLNMVREFRDICRPGMELLGERVRFEGFGSLGAVRFGHEETSIVKMKIVKKYKYIALMDDGSCQRWADLALLNMNIGQ